MDKKQKLFLVLAGIFLTNALLAEVIGVKLFSAENTMGVAPAGIRLFKGLVLDFNLTAGAIIWPVVFITTDIINEYFGKKGVRQISYLAAGLIAYAFLVIYVITLLPPAPFWLQVNATDAQGNPFDINYAFSRLFTQGLGIIAGSLTAFLLGQLIDVMVFQKLRRITGPRMIWLRATGSTLVSQLIDSFVVLGIAFYLLAPEGSRWSLAQVASVGIINYIYKFSVAILLTPAIYGAHFLIDRYLGKDQASQLIEQSASESKGFL
ncbi:MAG: queuosine precursor transporter [Cyclobacteriaceae bacterium]|nr:queuosine precursor transporter [Cyclobacteriaceae bacterium]